MNALVFLLTAALLEVGGDACVRWGLKSGRILGFILGAVFLLGYGLLVNLPRWDFGKLLGVYMVLFFTASQLTGVFIFGETLPTGRLVGGALVAAGGVCMMFWK